MRFKIDRLFSAETVKVCKEKKTSSQEVMSNTYDVFEVLPGMWSELPVSSHEVLTVRLGKFKWDGVDMITAILTGHDGI